MSSRSLAFGSFTSDFTSALTALETTSNDPECEFDHDDEEHSNSIVVGEMVPELNHCMENEQIEGSGTRSLSHFVRKTKNIKKTFRQLVVLEIMLIAATLTCISLLMIFFLKENNLGLLLIDAVLIYLAAILLNLFFISTNLPNVKPFGDKIYTREQANRALEEFKRSKPDIVSSFTCTCQRNEGKVYHCDLSPEWFDISSYIEIGSETGDKQRKRFAKICLQYTLYSVVDGVDGRIEALLNKLRSNYLEGHGPECIATFNQTCKSQLNCPASILVDRGSNKSSYSWYTFKLTCSYFLFANSIVYRNFHRDHVDEYTVNFHKVANLETRDSSIIDYNILAENYQSLEI